MSEISTAREEMRNRRLARGLTQAELAEQLWVSPVTVNRIENGKHLPSRHTKRAIQRRLGISIDAWKPFHDEAA